MSANRQGGLPAAQNMVRSLGMDRALQAGWGALMVRVFQVRSRSKQCVIFVKLSTAGFLKGGY
jgi:hypothetical protein